MSKESKPSMGMRECESEESKATVAWLLNEFMYGIMYDTMYGIIKSTLLYLIRHVNAACHGNFR